MKVAFYVGQFPSLSETFILRQITGLLDAGVDVDVYAHRADPVLREVPPEIERYGLAKRTTYWNIPASKVQRLRAAPQLFLKSGRRPGAALRALNPIRFGKSASSLTLLYQSAALADKPAAQAYDLLHCHFGPLGIEGVNLRGTGALAGRTLTTFHGYDANAYVRRTSRDVYRTLFARGDAFTANTRYTADSVIALGCPPEKIAILPVGLNLCDFDFHERTAPADGRFKFLSVGRLVEKKGFEFSLRAFAKIAAKHPNAEYTILGGGEQGHRHFSRVIDELNLGGRAKLLGPKSADEVRRFYRESHAFVLACVTGNNGDMEGQGLVLQEAQATGLPILTTWHNGLPEGVVPGKSAFLVPERDVAALAERMDFLIEHPALWPGMAAAGRQHAQRYDNGKLIDRLLKIYEQVLRGEPVGTPAPAVDAEPAGLSLPA